MRPQTRSPWELLQGVNVLHVIIWANVIVFVAQYVFGALGERLVFDDGTEQFMPFGGVSVEGLSKGRFWNAFTYMFVHGSLLHVGGNLMMIYFAGKRVLALLGTRHFLNIYFLSGLIGAAAELVVKAYAQGNTQIPIIGASACGFGLFFALAVMFPHEEVTALIWFIFPVRMRLWTMALGFLGISAGLGVFFMFFMRQSEAASWANFAHVGGALTGWYYLRLIGYGGLPMTFERLRRERSAFGLRPEMVRARHRRLSVNLEMDAGSSKARDSMADLISDEVDPILEKINEQGMGSLTDEERRTLERVSREISRRSRP
ncbi:MAG: rhomboid family intramembrane serine protease [Verrucomicrobiaceae bacterium]|nr:rhomboid family intramembrane serine protease [Verrucomicrobiaceae bacterium]